MPSGQTEPIVATRGLTAGSGFATDELACLMLDVMDELRYGVPEAALALYVDDGTVEVEGTRQQVQDGLKEATQLLAKGVSDIGLGSRCTGRSPKCSPHACASPGTWPRHQMWMAAGFFDTGGTPKCSAVARRPATGDAL